MYEIPEIVPVSPEEAAIVHAADEVERRLYAKSHSSEKEASEKAGRPVSDPMLFNDTPQDGVILGAKDKLAQFYKEKLRLDSVPILVAPSNIQPTTSSQVTAFHQYNKNNGAPLSQSALLDIFLDRIPVRRQGGSLFVWEGTHYQRASDDMMKGLISDTLREELRFTSKASMVGSILALLQFERRIHVESDLQSYNIGLKNGVLDLISMQLHQPNPNMFITHFLDSYWYSNASCPTFDAFLRSVTGGNPALSQRILEAFGFLLAPGNEAKRFVLLQGPPNTGKSLLGNLLQSFFLPGDIASLPLQQFGDRFGMSAIAGRRINVSMDLPSGMIEGKAAAIIKQITGGDLVFVEGKGKEGFGQHIRCKFLFGTNHPIELKVRDEAFAQRILLIPFRFPVPPNLIDVGLLNKLRQEKSGILFRALMAYREVVRHDYQFAGEDEFGFKAEAIVLPAQPSESLRSFVEQQCEPAPGTFTTTEALHRAFAIFCQETGLPTIMDRSAFSRALKNLLGDQIKPLKKRIGGASLNGYCGIRLKHECQDS